MPRVVFEPIGESIECGDEETVLDAAFRQGYSLVYGCREGQCSACKAYLLEGEVTLRRHSSFALTETEEMQGYTLLCRAMPDDDLVVELLHFDPDGYRAEFDIVDVEGTVRTVEAVTHDIARLVVTADLPFRAGMYADLHVPGTEERRSFSMSNLPGEGRLEFLIKRYPGGRFSGMLEGELQPGDPIALTGPYGSCYLRGGDRPILLAAGGSGMAPVLGLLRELAAAGDERPIRFFYGAREERDLFWTEEIEALGRGLADFRFVVALSDRDGVMVHEAIAGELDVADPECYLAGPPPMVDATIEILDDDLPIHFDKFTTAVAAEGVEP